mmetsp:Transcript_76420/g.132602  ORF Transcript_76420/g.132602 Transcript_76420/m.132602 type:complete len:223 (-) Transcript_76420:354-1022(-)
MVKSFKLALQLFHLLLCPLRVVLCRLETQSAPVDMAHEHTREFGKIRTQKSIQQLRPENIPGDVRPFIMPTVSLMAASMWSVLRSCFIYCAEKECSDHQCSKHLRCENKPSLDTMCSEAQVKRLCAWMDGLENNPDTPAIALPLAKETFHHVVRLLVNKINDWRPINSINFSFFPVSVKVHGIPRINGQDPEIMRNCSVCQSVRRTALQEELRVKVCMDKNR